MEHESPTNHHLRTFDKTSGPRELPQVDIHGTRFHVDVRNEEFREVANPANRITFDALNETPTGQNTFFYDITTKNVYRGSMEEMTTSDQVRFTKLPSIWELDREGMRQITYELAASLRAKREKRLSGQTDQSGETNAKQSIGKGKRP
jgi:hypothetical protein